MDLLEHIRLEFALHDKRIFLFENYGVVPELGSFLEKVDDILRPTIKRCYRTYDGSDNRISGTVEITPDKKMFFNKLIINYIFINSMSKTRRSNMTSMSNGTLTIFVAIQGDKNYISTNLSPILAHEILHGYEDYNLKKNSNDKVALIDTLKGTYAISTIIKRDYKEYLQETRMFADCIYWLSPQERRANLCRMEEELKDVCKEISDYRKAYETVKKTDIYKEYINIKNKVDFLLKNKKSIADTITDNICDRLNINITPKDISDIIETFKAQLKKFERKMNTNAPKILYDIYQNSYGRLLTDVKIGDWF